MPSFRLINARTSPCGRIKLPPASYSVKHPKGMPGTATLNLRFALVPVRFQGPRVPDGVPITRSVSKCMPYLLSSGPYVVPWQSKVQTLKGLFRSVLSRIHHAWLRRVAFASLGLYYGIVYANLGPVGSYC